MPRKVSAYKISGSLRYLSKAVFTKALTGGKTLLSNKTMFRKLGELKTILFTIIILMDQCIEPFQTNIPLLIMV